MQQLHVLDGDALEDDLTPVLLGASHYSEAHDFLGLLECLALLSYQVARTSPTELLNAEEAQALAELEHWQVAELVSMHRTLQSSEFAGSAFYADMSGVSACCRAAEFRQRLKIAEHLVSLRPGTSWTLQHELAWLQGSKERVFRAASIFVAWLHQRFELHYVSRDPADTLISSPARSDRVRPYVLRACSLPPGPRIRRIRLAGWQCDQAGGAAICATLLVVPGLRDPRNMIAALRDAAAMRTGPFFRRPAATRGVLVTELEFETSTPW